MRNVPYSFGITESKQNHFGEIFGINRSRMISPLHLQHAIADAEEKILIAQENCTAAEEMIASGGHTIESARTWIEIHDTNAAIIKEQKPILDEYIKTQSALAMIGYSLDQEDSPEMIEELEEATEAILTIPYFVGYNHASDMEIEDPDNTELANQRRDNIIDYYATGKHLETETTQDQNQGADFEKEAFIG